MMHVQAISSAPKAITGLRRMEKCRAALEGAFAALVQQCSEAGWKDSEIALTLADLADDHVEDVAKKLK